MQAPASSPRDGESANFSSRRPLSDPRTDPGCWWHVALWLAASDNGHDDGTIFTHDLTARLGWTLLHEEQRRDVVDLGIRYLSAHQIQPSQARCRLVDLAPPGEMQSILDAALGRLDALQAHGGRLSSRQLYNHLCPHLSTDLAERLLSGSYSGELAQDVLGMLVEHAPRAALTVCGILSDPGSALRLEARHDLATLDPSSLIDNLEANDVAPADIADLAPHLNLRLLDDARLAILGRLLLRCVPFASDPQEQFGVYRADRRYQVRSIRRRVMDLLAQHGQARLFEELASQPGDAGHELIAWYLRQARAHATDIAYTGLDDLRPRSPLLLGLAFGSTGNLFLAARVGRTRGDCRARRRTQSAGQQFPSWISLAAGPTASSMTV